MKLGMVQFQKIIYRNIMLEGVMRLVESVTDITESAEPQLYETAKRIIETQYDDLFVDAKKTITETSDQMYTAAYHFQKLSNLAESIAIDKAKILIEAKVELSDDKTELCEEELEMVKAVTEDIPENLADTIAERVAAALSADASRSDALNRSIDLMEKNGDAPEVIEKAIQEASAVPVSLYNSILTYSARQHMKLAINEGSMDVEAALRVNKKEIMTESKLMYTIFETFNVGLKEYSATDVKQMSYIFFKS